MEELYNGVWESTGPDIDSKVVWKEEDTKAGSSILPPEERGSLSSAAGKRSVV